jgi:hypothetical protein
MGFRTSVIGKILLKIPHNLKSEIIILPFITPFLPDNPMKNIHNCIPWFEQAE